MMRALLPRFQVRHWVRLGERFTDPTAEGRVLGFGWGRLMIEVAIGVKESR